MNTKALAFPLRGPASGLHPKHSPTGLPSRPSPWPTELARAQRRPGAAWSGHQVGWAMSMEGAQGGMLERA